MLPRILICFLHFHSKAKYLISFISVSDEIILLLLNLISFGKVMEYSYLWDHHNFNGENSEIFLPNVSEVLTHILLVESIWEKGIIHYGNEKQYVCGNSSHFPLCFISLSTNEIVVYHQLSLLHKLRKINGSLL